MIDSILSLDQLHLLHILALSVPRGSSYNRWFTFYTLHPLARLLLSLSIEINFAAKLLLLLALFDESWRHFVNNRCFVLLENQLVDHLLLLLLLLGQSSWYQICLTASSVSVVVNVVLRLPCLSPFRCESRWGCRCVISVHDFTHTTSIGLDLVQLRLRLMLLL